MSLQAPIIDLSREVLAEARHVFLSAEPYPHVVLDDLWNVDFLSAVAAEVPQIETWTGEKNFFGAVQKKWLSDWQHMPPTIRELLAYLNGISFMRILTEITTQQDLVSDPYLEGGGVHSIGTGGFLKLHTDFNWHEELQLIRRLNVLIYLNADWKDSYGGDLLFATDNNGKTEVRKRIAPIFNRTVIFITDDRSIHGHPEPLNCPAEVRRNSIATYYYQSPNGRYISDNVKKRTSTHYFK